jgi:hypothetical protein
VELAFSGMYFATSSVAGTSSLGDRSAQVVRSLGFCDAGVKKLATALSSQAGQLSRWVKYKWNGMV